MRHARPPRRGEYETPDASRSDAEILDGLASRLNRCGMSRIDPERFLEERNEIVVELRRMARRMAGERRSEPTTVWRAPPARTSS